MHQLLARWDESRGGWMTCVERAYEGLIPQPLGSFPASSTNQFVMIDAAGWQTMSTMLQTLSWTFKVCFLLQFFAWSQSFGVFYWFQGFLWHFPKASLGRFPFFFFRSNFHHVEVQIPRKAIAIAWSLELPKSLYVHAVHVTRRFGPGTPFRWKSEGQNRWHRSHSLGYKKLLESFGDCTMLILGYSKWWHDVISQHLYGMGALMGTPSS